MKMPSFTNSVAVLLSVVFALALNSSGALAGIVVTSATIETGRLKVSGTSSTGTQVQLDDLAPAAITGAKRKWSYDVVYHPEDCIVDLQVIGAVAPDVQAVVALCGPRGVIPRGAWSGTTFYIEDDLVTFGGSSWRALHLPVGTTNQGHTPGSDPNWSLYWEKFAAKGDKGDKGETGLQGLQGEAGAQGLQGLQGDTGAQGLQGPQGVAGVTGVQGPQGDPGATGAQGPQGETGPQGPTGQGVSNRVYRWVVFSTYDHVGSWINGNSHGLFGGVNPSVWTDSNGNAAQISSDKDVLRALFTNKAYPGKNALVWAETWYPHSSTNGRIVAALFRVRNSTASPIVWPVEYVVTC